MALTVWSETVDTSGKILKAWNTCTFSAYGMALEYAGFSAFPKGASTAAERDAFAGSYNTPAGATLAQVDKQAQSRYGVTLPAISGSLSDALKKPNTALVVTGNYSHLDPGSKLAGSVIGWNGYNKSGALPDVNHAVTVLVNPDGTLTWLDPTAPMGSNGVTVAAADVVKFNGGNLTNYPARQIAQNALGDSSAVPSIDVPFNSWFKANYPTEYAANAPITQDELLAWFAYAIQTKDIASTTKLAQDALKIGAWDWKDKPMASAPDSLNTYSLSKDISTPLDPLSTFYDAMANIAVVLGKLTNPVNWLHLGAMAVGVGLVGFGMVIVARDLNETGPQGLVSPIPVMLKRGA